MTPSNEELTSFVNAPNSVQTVEYAVGLLLPYAVSHVFTPPSTPITWREHYHSGATEPHGFTLRLNLDRERTRKVDWDAVLQRDQGETPGSLWTCTVVEPAPEEYPQATGISTTLNVFGNKTEVGRKLVRDMPEFPDTGPVTIGGEWDFGLSETRREELIEHVADAVCYAVAALPRQQAEFVEAWRERNRRPDVERRPDIEDGSFEMMASPISKNVLSPLLNVITYFNQVGPPQG